MCNVLICIIESQNSTVQHKGQSKLFSLVEMSGRLRQERKSKQLNQADFGALGGVGLQTQSRYEKAETEPSASYFASLAEAGVDVLYILTGRKSADSLPDDVSVIAQIVTHMPGRSRSAFMNLLQVMAHEWGFMPAGIAPPTGMRSVRAAEEPMTADEFATELENAKARRGTTPSLHDKPTGYRSE